MGQAATPEGKERRGFRRVQLTLPVRFRAEDRSDGWFTGSTRDVSALGMLVATQVCVDVATPLSLLFTVPSEQEPRQLRALVTRVELGEAKGSYLLGVKFVDLDEAARKHIAAALQETDIMGLLRLAVETHASDVHLSTNHPPLVRVAGRLGPLRNRPIAPLDLKHMIYSLMDERQRGAFERDLELNFSLSIEPTIRYRVNVHSQRGNVEAAFRRIEPAIRSTAELHLPPIIERFSELQDGLILVTGPTGAGKTTTVSAMVDYINATRAAVVITLELPIEYVYAYKRSVIKQREVGIDTHSFPIALREAMRQDPDVIVVGEVRDEETMKTALDASETGHLVLATFPAASCTDSILRVIHFFPKDRQQETQLQLANSLRAVISQRLLPRADAVGVIPATEILVNTMAVANLIRSGTIEQIPSVIQTSLKQGMYNLDSSLERLYRSGLISLETVKQHSENLDELMRRFEGTETPSKPPA
ncbi:MAG: PilT/PilU family type 4a pilus ATPase [Candidatus Omnitrophica bacterium]|nr:PilT/PilU family type 4a pilus ATPase [Candidatus Omnitrophota bacterium]